MSVLADDVFHAFGGSRERYVSNGMRYLRKPEPPPLTARVIDAWRVLTGRAVAIHFKEDNPYDFRSRY